MARMIELAPKLHRLAMASGVDAGVRILLHLSSAAGVVGPVRESLTEALGDPRWTEAALRGEFAWLVEALDRFSKYVPGEEYNAIVIALLADPSTEEGFADEVARRFRSKAANAPATVRAILSRLLDGDAAGDPPVYNAVSEAIRSLGRDRLEGWQETLRRLAREGRYLEPVVGAMGDSRDPSFVPDLARIVLESSGNLPSDRVITQLASFLTDESAEALLAIAAHVQYSSPRQQCLDAVESIRAFQDARERWAGRRLARATRQQATVDLLELLDSDIEEQRVQAVRGLGTLGAVETLPRLIRLLEDPSEGIREAARGALDRLNRLNEEEGQ
jgi:hypothetical protein